jgi:hypothetical protein
MYVPSFIKIGSGIQTLMEGGNSHTDPISLLLFFQNEESRVKTGRMYVSTA